MFAENGHTVPSIETLEKLARALEVPLYQLFYDGDKPPELATLLKREDPAVEKCGTSGKWATYFRRLQTALSRTKKSDRELLLFMLTKMTRKNRLGRPASMG
jgi:transcriptional regulator with XRE-family HTH domain